MSHMTNTIYGCKRRECLINYGSTWHIFNPHPVINGTYVYNTVIVGYSPSFPITPRLEVWGLSCSRADTSDSLDVHLSRATYRVDVCFHVHDTIKHSAQIAEVNSCPLLCWRRQDELQCQRRLITWGKSLSFLIVLFQFIGNHPGSNLTYAGNDTCWAASPTEAGVWRLKARYNRVLSAYTGFQDDWTIGIE